MSLNRTLDRLFNAIRLEARRNPDFADRLDAILRAHDSQREIDDAVAAEALNDAPVAEEAPAAIAPPEINPVGVFQSGGEDALKGALAREGRDALMALIAEHNLDPAGETAELDRDGLQAHVIAQAKRRVERDKKLFDY